MKNKIISIIVFFAFVANVSAQIEVHSSNKVGIGTTNPLYKLHVVGDTYVTGNLHLSNATNLLKPDGTPLIDPLSGFSGSATNTNVSFGYEALLNRTDTCKNTAVGYKSLYYNTSGYNNTATGYCALYSNTIGYNNTATGHRAFYSHTNGSGNTANGYYALFNNTVGVENTANGGSSLGSNITGRNNTANGNASLARNTVGNYNTANGSNALFSNINVTCKRTNLQTGRKQYKNENKTT